MQEGASQHVQGDQGHDDQVALHSDAIVLTAPCPWHRVDKEVVPAGIAIADKSFLLVGSHGFVDDNDTPNITFPCKGNHPTKRGKEKVFLLRLDGV